MRIAIIGAGVSGLACARTLHRLGHEVVVFEKSRGVSGRCATRRIGPYTFDTGATSVAPRGRAIEKAMLEELDTTDLVKIERPIYVHKSLRVEPGESSKNGQQRYTWRKGINTLGKLLAAGLDIRFNHLVERFDRERRLHFTATEGSGMDGPFDRIVIAIPTPQAHALIVGSGESRSIEYVHYRPCLSVLFGFAAQLEHVPYHALIEPEQTHPLTWLSIESVKSPERAPAGHTAMVAQMSPAYSRLHYESPDETIVRATLEYLVRLYGQNFAQPEVVDVKRWRYSLPENIAMFESANPKGSSFLVAGDGMLGGRVEFAYETGVLAANRIIEESA